MAWYSNLGNKIIAPFKNKIKNIINFFINDDIIKNVGKKKSVVDNQSESKDQFTNNKNEVNNEKKDTPLSSNALRDFIKSKRKANQVFIFDNLTAKAILHEDGANEYSEVLKEYGLKFEKIGSKLESNHCQLVDDGKYLIPSKLKKELKILGIMANRQSH